MMCRYDVMLRCWQNEPEERPGFAEIVNALTDVLDEGTSL